MPAEAAFPDSLAGSIVILDPRNGAVLAMASRPTFDPNVFVSFKFQQDRLRLMSSDNDLLNRSLHGQVSTRFDPQDGRLGSRS